MAVSKIVLDTNAYSALMKGDSKIVDILNKADQIMLPSFVIGELLNGFRKGNKENWNAGILEKFESRLNVSRIHPTNETIEIFVDLFEHLRLSGTPIPIHDIWIAALCIQNGGTLITYDKHFRKLPQLRIWKNLSDKK